MTIKSIVLQCILKWMCLSAISVSVMPFFFISIRSIIIFINIIAYFVFCHINIPLFTQISIQINTMRIHQWTLCYWKAKASKYNRSIRVTYFFSNYFRKNEKAVSKKKTISGENHRSTWIHWQYVSKKANTVHLTLHGDITHNLKRH